MNVCFISICNRKAVLSFGVSLLILLTGFGCQGVSAQDSGPNFNDAWSLYQGKQYAKAADAFEALIKSSKPSTKLFYYAALANFAAHRKSRAKQLAQHIVNSLPNSKEAGYCAKLFPDLAIAKPSSEPEKNEEGKADAKADESGDKTASKKKKKKPKFYVKEGFRRGERPFTAADIAKDGAAGIDQNINPNCWFEASMAALAELPRGQRLIADMIRYGDEKGYIVRFPGDGVEYKITKEELRRQGINDKALWASLIECAQVMKFPGNRGAEGPSGTESRLAVGLGCITGCRAEILRPANASHSAISSFIGGAVSSKNPIVASTMDEGTVASTCYIVFPAHAYTIIGFEPHSKMITLRNPHGKESRKWYPSNAPGKDKFVQKEDGVFKLHIDMFQKLFWEVCRSNI